MQKPSDNWKRLRRAVLERVHQDTIERLEPIFMVYLIASAVYLAGFLHFNFIHQPLEYSWLAGVTIISVAISGVLVTLLTGSVLTLFLTSKRLERLINE